MTNQVNSKIIFNWGISPINSSLSEVSEPNQSQILTQQIFQQNQPSIAVHAINLEPNIQDLLETGINQYNIGHYSNAIELFSKCIGLVDKSQLELTAQLHLFMGKSLYRIGKLNDAFVNLNYVLNLTVGNIVKIEALQIMALSYCESKQFDFLKTLCETAESFCVDFQSLAFFRSFKMIALQQLNDSNARSFFESLQVEITNQIALENNPDIKSNLYLVLIKNYTFFNEFDSVRSACQLVLAIEDLDENKKLVFQSFLYQLPPSSQPAEEIIDIMQMAPIPKIPTHYSSPELSIAIQHFNKGQHDLALENLTSILSLPDVGDEIKLEAYRYLTQIYYYKMQFDDVVKICNSALSLLTSSSLISSPETASYLLYASWALKRLNDGDYEKFNEDGTALLNVLIDKENDPNKKADLLSIMAYNCMNFNEITLAVNFLIVALDQENIDTEKRESLLQQIAQLQNSASTTLHHSEAPPITNDNSQYSAPAKGKAKTKKAISFIASKEQLTFSTQSSTTHNSRVRLFKKHNWHILNYNTYKPRLLQKQKKDN